MSVFISMSSRLKNHNMNVQITTGQGLDYLKEYLSQSQLHPDLHPDVEKRRLLALKIVESLESAIRDGVDPD